MAIAIRAVTATSTEELVRFGLVRIIGGQCRLADDSGELATHHAPRRFDSGASAGLVPLSQFEVYRGILSAACSSDDNLFQDTGGLISPSATGAPVGRARSAQDVGEVVEYLYEGGGGGGGTGGSQVESTYTLTRTSFDADISSLTSSQLLTLVQNEDARYASTARLDDYDNIWVLDGDTLRQRTYKTFNGVAELKQDQPGIQQGPRDYDLITSPDSIHTARTSGDWFNGSPNIGDRLSVVYTPRKRNQRQLFIWSGSTWDLLTDTLLAKPNPGHGLDLTDKEGQRVPVAWHLTSDSDPTGRAPATIDEVTHFAVATQVGASDTLLLRTSADMDGRYYDEITNGLGARSESIFWDSSTNLHTRSATDLRLFQVSTTDVEIIRFALEDTRAMGGVGLTPVVAEYDQSANIPAGTIINLNADTGSLLTLRAGEGAYTSHDFGANASAFNSGYGKSFWIEKSGIRLNQEDLMYTSASTVRIDVLLPSGTNAEISVHSLV